MKHHSKAYLLWSPFYCCRFVVAPVWQPRWTVLLLAGTLRSFSECLCRAPLKMAFTCLLWAASSCNSQRTISVQVRARRATTRPFIEVAAYVCLGVGSALHRRGFFARLQGEGARQLPGQLLQRTLIRAQQLKSISSLASELQVLYKTAALKSWL